MGDDLLTLTVAARMAGVSKQTLWRRIKAGVLPTYQSELNRRVKLVRRADLERLMRPEPVEGQKGKVAA